MPIDYSRWDGLELSDDDNFECHPNVDKGSMIRWKQADIHKKRREGKDNLAALKLEDGVIEVFLNELNKDLVNIQSKTKSLEELKAESAQKYGEEVKKLDQDYHNAISKERDYRWGPPIADEFVMKRIDPNTEISASSKDTVVEVIEGIIKKIELRRKEVRDYVREKEEESSRKIIFDDLSTGYDKTIISNTIDKTKSEDSLYRSNEVVSEISEDENLSENLDFSTEEGLDSVFESEFDRDIEYISDNDAKKFSKISDIQKTRDFILSHPSIIKSECADMILAEAFKLRMMDDVEGSKLCVRQSLLIRYICLMPKNTLDKTVDVFLNEKQYTSEFFRTDIEKSFEKIESRVAKLKEKNRLKREKLYSYVDSLRREDGSYPAPKKGKGEDDDIVERRKQLFDKLPHDLQRTLILRDTKKLNEYLSTLTVEEGENTLKEWNSVNLITIDNASFDEQSDHDDIDTPQISDEKKIDTVLDHGTVLEARQ